MGIFDRSADDAGAAALAVAFTKPERERIAALWRLTALPREVFDATYGAMLAGFWRYVRAPQDDAWTVLKEQALTCCIAALRVRQAHVLPRFAAAEDAARLAEGMSFALAACVVAERFGLVAGRARAPGWRPLTADLPAAAVLDDDPVPRAYGALLLPRLAGAAGVAWLGQERAVMRAVAAYFGDGPSELRTIAAEAERRIGLALDRGTTAVPAAATAECPAPGTGGESPAPDAAPAPHPGTAAAPAGAPDAALGAGGGGWRWVNWVRTGLRDGTVVANTAGGWLHNIGGEAYVVVPDGFAAFAALEGLPAGTVKNRVSRLGRHRGRMSKFGPTGTFHAQLADGRHAKGMLFPGALFWDEDAPPQADAELRKPWR